MTSSRSCYYCKQPSCSPPTLCALPTTPSSSLFMRRKHGRDNVTDGRPPRTTDLTSQSKVRHVAPNDGHTVNTMKRSHSRSLCLFSTRIFTQPAKAQSCSTTNDNKLVCRSLVNAQHPDSSCSHSPDRFYIPFSQQCYSRGLLHWQPRWQRLLNVTEEKRSHSYLSFLRRIYTHTFNLNSENSTCPFRDFTFVLRCREYTKTT